MSIFGNSKPAPVAIPAPDGGPMALSRETRIVRRPIFQSVQSRPEWAVEMVERIAAAKALGFTLFEVDVTNVQTPQEKSSEYSGMFIIYSAPIEGDEWKGEDAERKLVKNRVITVYALVAE